MNPWANFLCIYFLYLENVTEWDQNGWVVVGMEPLPLHPVVPVGSDLNDAPPIVRGVEPPVDPDLYPSLPPCPPSPPSPPSTPPRVLSSSWSIGSPPLLPRGEGVPLAPLVLEEKEVSSVVPLEEAFHVDPFESDIDF
jgi:hypothetical protein